MLGLRIGGVVMLSKSNSTRSLSRDFTVRRDSPERSDRNAWVVLKVLLFSSEAISLSARYSAKVL